jgi:hypothetical protein
MDWRESSPEFFHSQSQGNQRSGNLFFHLRETADAAGQAD